MILNSRNEPVEVVETTTPTGRRRLLVSPQGAAHLLDCGRTTVYELMASGELQSVRIGRSRRIPVAELERFIAERLGNDE